jgi:hypothetical protein
MNAARSPPVDADRILLLEHGKVIERATTRCSPAAAMTPRCAPTRLRGCIEIA